jgi:pimeloyl-ACP methyl ester carboxylesterase
MADPAADAGPAAAGASGSAPVNGVRLWYATFGADQGEPVILLHGGLANSDYWGHQVRALMNRYRVVVMDSRGHGRSTRNEQPYGYDLMESDVSGLMDFLKIPKATIVGWSDGAIIGLDLAMHHQDRVAKLFAFAANSDPSGVTDIARSPVFNAFIAHADRVQGVPRPDHPDVGDPAELDRRRPEEDHGPDLDRGRRPRRGDQAREHRVHGGQYPGCRAAIAARGQSFLISAGSGAIHLGRAAFSGAGEEPLTTCGLMRRSA